MEIGHNILEIMVNNVLSNRAIDRIKKFSRQQVAEYFKKRAVEELEKLYLKITFGDYKELNKSEIILKVIIIIKNLKSK